MAWRRGPWFARWGEDEPWAGNVQPGGVRKLLGRAGTKSCSPGTGAVDGCRGEGAPVDGGAVGRPLLVPNAGSSPARDAGGEGTGVRTGEAPGRPGRNRRAVRRRGARAVTVLVAAALAAGVLSGVAGPAPAPVRAASSISELRQKINDANETLRQLEQRQAEAQRKLKALKQDEASIAERVRILEAQIRETRVKLAELTGKVREAEARVEAKQQEIDEATRQLEQREDYVARRIRAIQENGTVGVLEVLFEANSFSDFLTRLDLLSQILRHDLDVMAQVQAERERLVAEKKELDAERQKLVALKAEVERQQKQLNATVASHKDELARLAEQRRRMEEHLEALEADSKEVERLLKNLQADLKRQLEALNRNRAPRSGGRFLWPVPGEYTITSGFNPARRHPIYGTVRPHTGIDIDGQGPPDPNPSTWDEIVAADDGVVVASRYMPGYGNTIIIAHDETYSTLYGHLSRRYVEPGQVVRRGQVIGLMGTTGASTGTHLHFEVRVNGQPVNPMPYLR
ncbi:peptidoglycan DD-metalloendopeptidase family protein [Thermaerobacter sp. PB12/4term]|uniref:murein hydrolase activator EnvC family protein n=1 Tax=Thermaerobacter sp. PB12/4term TaxID=2293838 RepID=UPI000E32848F|nr:M23 family metallopeptidase [Thermaerobacter sp. PB12/4term]QIA26265.1 peptidoglycan DD-metalloendopeptidase family protein [Thermaerobacter sp. PB12/4term]